MRIAANRSFSLAAGVFCVALGGLALAGWFTGAGWLVQVHERFQAVHYSVAACFLLLGLGLCAALHQLRIMALALASAAGAVALLCWVQVLLGADFGIDRVLTSPLPGREYPPAMSPLLAVTFMLAAISLALMILQSPVRSIAAAIFSAWSLLIGAMALIIFVLSAVVYSDPNTRMAVPVAAGLVMLGAGIAIRALQGSERSQRVEGSLRLRVAIGYALALLLLIGVALASQLAVQRLVASQSTVTRALRVRAEIAQLYSLLKDVQRGQRGFALTGEPEYLQPYHAGRRALLEQLPLLRGLFTNPEQLRRFQAIESLIERQLAQQEKKIQIRQAQGPAAAREQTLSREGERGMEEIQRQIMALQAAQDEVARQRIELSERAAFWTGLVNVGGILLAIAVVASGLVVLFRGLTARERAEEEVRQLNRVLTERSTALASLNLELAAAEEEARRQKQLFQSVSETASVGLVAADENGRMIFINEAAKKILGRGISESPAEEWSNDFQVWLPDGSAMVPPQDLPLVRAMRGEVVRDVPLLLRMPGRPEVQIVGTGIPLLTSEGTLGGGLVTFFDNTETLEHEAFLQQLIESAPDAMVIANESGVIVRTNAQATKLFGFEKSEMLGQPIEMLMPSRFHARHEGQRARYAGAPVARPMGVGLDLLGRRKDGSEFHVEISLAPIATRHGTLLSSAIRDVSERRRAQQALQTANQQLEQVNAELAAVNRELESFSYSVSHDLRAPLRHLMGFSQMLREDFGPSLPTEVHKYLSRIQDSAERMGNLIDGLLNLGRVGRRDLIRLPVDLRRITNEVREMLQSECAGRAVDWRIGQLPAVHSDPALTRQVLENLIGNAIKYTRGRSPAIIEIGFASGDGEEAIFVRDNGVGFDMKFSHKLFGVFQRLHSASEFEGTGIGLATVQRIVKKHGGRVWAESAPGAGATFYFTLGAATLPPLNEAAAIPVTQEVNQA